MTTHNNDRTDRTKLRRSALVSLGLMGMLIELRWSPQLGGGRKAFDHDSGKKLGCPPDGIFQGYEGPYIQNRVWAETGGQKPKDRGRVLATRRGRGGGVGGSGI